MLQFGGHHLAINLTIRGNDATMAPSLPAAQPASFTIEGKTVRPLGDENDKAFALINALDAKQQSQAILPSRVADLVLGPGNDGKTIQPEGIRASALSAQQQNMLWDIVHEWTGIEADDPDALTRRYHYYDPIYTLPEDGQRWWRDKISAGVDELLTELQQEQGITVDA